MGEQKGVVQIGQSPKDTLGGLVRVKVTWPDRSNEYEIKAADMEAIFDSIKMEVLQEHEEERTRNTIYAQSRGWWEQLGEWYLTDYPTKGEASVKPRIDGSCECECIAGKKRYEWIAASFDEAIQTCMGVLGIRIGGLHDVRGREGLV